MCTCLQLGIIINDALEQKSKSVGVHDFRVILDLLFCRPRRNRKKQKLRAMVPTTHTLPHARGQQLLMPTAVGQCVHLFGFFVVFVVVVHIHARNIHCG